MRAGTVFACACFLVLSACGPREPETSGSPPAMRRLTEAQYRNIIIDAFGPTITFGGRFDPLQRTDGLLALGARTARITPGGFEQYYTVARSIAGQVVDETHRETIVPCMPASADAPDDACASRFFGEAGRLLYRRALTTSELDMAVRAAHEVAESGKDFYKGLAFGLTGFLVSPKFLFVTDTVEQDPTQPNSVRLTGPARAARLSFLLWNSGPDDALLTAAEKGALVDRGSLTAQVERMMRSPKFEDGLRAFFADFLDFQKFETLEKDTVIYPAFNVRAGEDAQEQLMRTIADHVIVRDRDYRDLFTTRETFLTPRLALIYRVPAQNPAGGWSPYTFAKDDPHAGIATTIGFLAVNSHPGRSSPTIRGRAIRETLLCQRVPDPPGAVDFSVFNDPNSPHKTARERLTAHRTADACAGCHKITDPIGLALETFDGAGATRAAENGEPIDPSGDLDGIAFKDAVGLGKALRDNPAAASCLVNRLYTYALGRPTARGDADSVVFFQKAFQQTGYRMKALLEKIALSDAFYKVAPASDAKTAGESSPAGGPS